MEPYVKFRYKTGSVKQVRRREAVVLEKLGKGKIVRPRKKGPDYHRRDMTAD